MKIKIQQSLINSIPSVIVYTTDWSGQELDAMLRFGEPSVDIGGAFYKRPCELRPDPDPEPPADCESNDVCETDDYFFIPSRLKRVRSEFPIMMTFDREVFSDPQAAGSVWASEIARRIALEVKDLRYNGTMFDKEETYEV